MHIKEILCRQNHVDVDYFLMVLNKYEENTWVFPAGNDYSVFSDLYEFNLVSRMSINKWHNGNFKGQAIGFKYNLQLNYGD
jgi:hypothetical protein